MLNPRRVLTQAADPRQRLALRLRRRRERRRDVRQLPAQEARSARAAADPDGAARRLRAARVVEGRCRVAQGAPARGARRRSTAIGLVVAGIATYAVVALVPRRPGRPHAATGSAEAIARSLERGQARAAGGLDAIGAGQSRRLRRLGRLQPGSSRLGRDRHRPGETPLPQPSLSPARAPRAAGSDGDTFTVARGRAAARASASGSSRSPSRTRR